MILAWSIPAAELGGLAKRWREVQAWFDVLLLERERDGEGTFDGYLTLILSASPRDADLQVLREIEADTSVCRKHVLWPGKHGFDDIPSLLLHVTALALPSSVAATEAASLAGIDQWGQRFIQQIDSETSGAKVARAHLGALVIGEDSDEDQ